MSISEFLALYWTSLTVFPAYFLVIVVAIIRWKHHPLISGLAILAFSIFGLLTLSHLGLNYWATTSIRAGGSAESAGFTVGVAQGILWIPHFLAEMVLIVAIFGDRGRAGNDT